MIGLGRMGANMVRRLIREGTAVWSSIGRKAVEELVEVKRLWDPRTSEIW
jgi:6-phosphogluconate dehydrogenase (decarboxylating)